eukprot:jgi/Botrbrau1/16404/Bobra.0142s0004.1
MRTYAFFLRISAYRNGSRLFIIQNGGKRKVPHACEADQFKFGSCSSRYSCNCRRLA